MGQSQDYASGIFSLINYEIRVDFANRLDDPFLLVTRVFEPVQGRSDYVVDVGNAARTESRTDSGSRNLAGLALIQHVKDELAFVFVSADDLSFDGDIIRHQGVRHEPFSLVRSTWQNEVHQWCEGAA